MTGNYLLRQETRGGAFLRPLCWAAAFLMPFIVCYAYMNSMDDPLGQRQPFLMLLSTPAVFFAAGHGLGTADVAAIPELESFIRRETDAFDVSHIPADIELAPISTAFELTHYYLILSVGVFWRLFGVSIWSVLLLLSLLYGLCGLALYGLFRQGLNRAVSLVALAIVCTSPYMLYMCACPREFAKVPFFLWAFLLLVILLTRSLSPPKLFLLSALLGLVLGVGLGIRQDLLICLPPAAATLFCFSSINSRFPWTMRFISVLAFLAVFLPLARLPFRGMALEGAQVSVHSYMQGTSHDMEDPMQFGGASYRSQGAKDNEVYAQVNTYGQRHGDSTVAVDPATAEGRRRAGEKTAPLVPDPGLYFSGPRYLEHGRALMREMLFLFPADLVARAWRSVVAVYDVSRYAYDDVDAVAETVPAWLCAPVWLSKQITQRLGQYGIFFVVAMLLMLSAVRFRLALGLTGMLLWFTGYPSIVFEFRHLYYLLFIPVGAAACCVAWPLRALRTVQRNHAPLRPTQAPRAAIQRLRRALHLVLILLLLWLGPLLLLRTWQNFAVSRLAARLAATTLEPFPAHIQRYDERLMISPAQTLPGLAQADDAKAGETYWEYVAVVVDTYGRDIPVTILYDRKRQINDYSQDLTIFGVDNGGTGRATLFFPVYDSSLYEPESFYNYMRIMRPGPWKDIIADPRPVAEQEWLQRSRFIGLAFPESVRSCIVGFHVVRNIGALPILPVFQTPEDRAWLRPYKTGPWERSARCLLARLLQRSPDTHDPVFRRWCNCTAPAWNAPLQASNGELSPWILDEALLRHQHPPKPLASAPETVHAAAIIEQWRACAAHIPDQAETAAQTLAGLGTAWRAAGRNADAQAAYQAASELDETKALYFMRLGQLALEAKNTDQALVHFRAALLLEPLLPLTTQAVDDLFSQRDDPAGQAQFWAELFAQHPDSWPLGMRAGDVYESQGEIEAAAAVYKQVRAAHPDHPDTQTALARCLGKLGDLDQAIMLASDAVARYPDRAPPTCYFMTALGNKCMEQADVKGAQQAFAAAIKFCPEDPMPHLNLGDALLQSGNASDALHHYEQALTLARETNADMTETLSHKINALRSETP